MKINQIICLLFALLLSSCSTQRKTLLYSSGVGAATGAVIGRGASPDKESNLLNTGIGAAIGTVIGLLIGYFIYEDGNPTKNLKEVSPEDSKDKKGLPYESKDPGKEDEIDFLKGMEPVGEKKPVKATYNENIHKDVKEELKKKQFVQDYKIPKKIIKKDGKTIIVPEQRIMEIGVEE